MYEVNLLFVILFVYLGDTANAFVCQEQGVFENTDSNDCSTFIVCDSNLNAQVNSCSRDLFFWPEKKGCFSNYNCATRSMLGNNGNTNPCEGVSSYQQIPDNTVADCSSYVECSQQWIYVDNDYIIIPSVSHRECISGSIFRYQYGCVSPSSYTCTNYQCPAAGYFENPDTNDCSTFIDCENLSTTGTVLNPSVKTCPLNTKFSPFINKCDEFYNCDGNDPHNGIDPCLTYNWASPFVANPQSNDCSTYLQCHHQGTSYDDRMDVIVQKTCPASTKFSPIVGKCYYNHDCNQSCSKDPCSNGEGKFVDFESGQCRNFIECRDTSEDETIYEPVYEKVFCPPGALFSPETSKCDRDYVCPKFAVNYCYPEIPTVPPPTTTTPAAAAA